MALGIPKSKQKIPTELLISINKADLGMPHLCPEIWMLPSLRLVSCQGAISTGEGWKSHINTKYRLYRRNLEARAFAGNRAVFVGPNFFIDIEIVNIIQLQVRNLHRGNQTTH